MKKEKLIKKQIIEEASAHPEKYFPVKTLEKLGLKRQKCSKCSTMFWSTEKRDVCGDTECVGGYTFIAETPAKKSLEFCDVYLEFRKFMEKRGYLHVDRFPIVARWRDDLDFNIASIIGFQPYVTKGVVAPPAELVIIPQNCLRFADIDNVGYTGRHFTGFTMIGQLAFKDPKKYDQAKYVQDMFEFLTDVVKVDKTEIQIHEDAWVGGGDCGPSIEFFSRGVELLNQVYMWFDMSEADDIKGLKPLKIKVLDMGMGMERICWFSKGSLNAFEACMPRVTEYLLEKINLKPNWEVYKSFVPHSGRLNLDEVDDIDKAWDEIAQALNLTAEKLKEEIEPLVGIYSLADHTRTLLYALTDGALPSNVKGGYNLRLVLRRALDFIYKFKWNIDLYDVIVVQAEELTPLYPELKDELQGIKKIIDLEVKKYEQHKDKVENKIKSIIKKDKELTEQDYITYYISEGITPEEIQESFAKQGKKIPIPGNFFTLVNEFFESRKQSATKEHKQHLAEYVEGLPETELLFYKDTFQDEGDAKIIKEFEHEKKKYVVLDKTLFYATSGGQAHDIGFIDDKEVIDVIKIGKVVVHQVK